METPFLKMTDLAPALAVRGEGVVQIGARALKLKTNHEALEGIEEDLDCSIIKVMQRIIGGDVRFKDIKVITFRLARAAGEPVSVKDVGELLLKNEYIQLAPAILRVLADAVTAGKAEIPNG